MLGETKVGERREREGDKEWDGMRKVMTPAVVQGGLKKSPCLGTDCISIQWSVAGLHRVAHLGLRVYDCVWWTCKENSKNGNSNTISSEQLQAGTEEGKNWQMRLYQQEKDSHVAQF